MSGIVHARTDLGSGACYCGTVEPRVGIYKGFQDLSAYDYGGQYPDSAWAKFRKECGVIAVGKALGIAEGRFGHEERTLWSERFVSECHEEVLSFVYHCDVHPVCLGCALIRSLHLYYSYHQVC